MKKLSIILIALLSITLLAYYILPGRTVNVDRRGSRWIGSSFTEKSEWAINRPIREGRTFAEIAKSTGITYETMLKILASAKDVYNLEKVIAGNEISFLFDKEFGELQKIVYQIDSEDVLVVGKVTTSSWIAKRSPIPYEVKLEEVEGTIESSLFQTITEAGGDERVALALAEMFAWQIDFAADIRQGDKFKAIYEKRYLNGNYISPGSILAARFINDGREFRGIYFANNGGEEGFYDEDGLSLQKIFLKSPLSYRYISSGFSYNRLNPVTRSNYGPHRAIDYAANYGTPVVVVGDGTVVLSGWKGGLGKAVFVRHNDTYTTVYAHLSRTAVRYGSKVKQGQIIGYVGATGEVTGPHLHFEMRKNGARRNPLTIELPPGDPVVEEDRAEFEKTLAQFEEFFGL